MPEALVYAEPLTTCEHFQTSNHVRCARLTSSRMRGHICFDRHVRSCLELPRTNRWEHSDIYFHQKCVITYREAQATGQSIHGVAGEKRKATKRNTAMAKPQTPAVVKCCIYIQLPSLAADCVMAEHCTCHSTFHHCCCIKSKTFDRKGIRWVPGERY